MRVDDHRSSAVRHDRARELRDRDHRAFDMEMAIDQTRREISAGDVDDFFRLIIAEANHASIVHRHVGLMDFAAEDVDEPRVFEQDICRSFAAGDAELVLNFPHDKTCSATACSGVAPAGCGALTR